ncbi:MAG: acyltransferase family protein [Proteobacteria bacterium]|nr:acyltransferase family protein [Pseudomonadota bacterium]
MQHASTDRLHALDNLRALMMWLGIVLHVSVSHMVNDSPLPWHDDRSTPVADLLSAFIHTFRMPVFFILAGFFAAMLVQKRGVRGMVGNRLRRLGLPFAIFWPPVFAASAVLALLFLHRMVRGTWGLDASIVPPRPNMPTGLTTMHLWFLWMLLWFCVLAAPVLWVGERLPAVSAAMTRVLARLGGTPWGFAVLALPLAAVGALYPQGVVVPSGAFVPPLAEWLHNGLFFVFGWALWRHQQALFALYTRRWVAFALAGLPLFLATGGLVEAQRAGQLSGWNLPLCIAYVYNGASWLWSFAFIGLFLRYLQGPHPVLGYLADSSYWVYLLHLPLTIGFGALLFGAPLPALAKMTLNVAATTAVCLASYHLLVRYTAVSSLLNGKRHARQAQVSATR